MKTGLSGDRPDARLDGGRRRLAQASAGSAHSRKICFSSGMQEPQLVPARNAAPISSTDANLSSRMAFWIA